MNLEQRELLDRLELSLAHMVYDNHHFWAGRWGKVIEYLENGEYAVAVLEGENLEVDKEVLNIVRKTFDVRY